MLTAAYSTGHATYVSCASLYAARFPVGMGGGAAAVCAWKVSCCQPGPESGLSAARAACQARSKPGGLQRVRIGRETRQSTASYAFQGGVECPASAPVRQIQGFEERRISGSS